MSRTWRPETSAGRRLAGVLDELAVPVPFRMDGWRSSLEDYLGRSVRLVPVAMGSDAPSGVFVQTAGADYLYYEQRTSPFHQVHIVASLAARALLSDPAHPTVDPRLVPGMPPRLAESMLGAGALTRLDDRDADAFAVQVAARVGVSVAPVSEAWRALRRLRPLHRALTRVVPQVVRPLPAGLAGATWVRLHLRVVEMRDAMLALRPWRAGHMAWSAAATARAAGLLGGDAFTAKVEAAVLVGALRAWQSGEAPQAETCGVGQPFGLRADLYGEATWLAKVSSEFVRHPLGRALAARGMAESRAKARGAAPDQRGVRRLLISRDRGESARRVERGSVQDPDFLDGQGTPMEAWALRSHFVRRACSES